MQGSKYWDRVGDNKEYVTSNPALLAGPEESTKMENNSLLEVALSKLTEQQKWLIINYFGIFGHGHMTYNELGTHLRISRQATTKRVHVAIHRLRKFIRKMERQG